MGILAMATDRVLENRRVIRATQEAIPPYPTLLALAGLGALAVAALGFWFLHPGLTSGGERTPEEVTAERQEQLRGERLSAWHAEVRRRDRASTRVIRALLSERLTLWQAAAALQGIDRRCSDPARHARLTKLYFPGRTEAESYCRRVIRNVRETGRQRSAALASRLEAELEERLGRGDTLSLPETPVRISQGAREDAGKEHSALPRSKPGHLPAS
jgi:hypothetical protein